MSVTIPGDAAARAARAASFDQVAELYDRARPGYPEAAVEALCEGLAAGSRVLEVGCGTGQLTRELVGRSLEVLALEPGPSLAALARRLPVEVRQERLEEAELPSGFSLAVGAQSLHWVDPAQGLARLVPALAPGGRLAALWNLDRSQSTPFYQATNPIYRRWFPGDSSSQGSLVEGWARAMEAHPGLEGFEQRGFGWVWRLSRDEYLDLLRTQSPTRSLADPEAFVAEIGEVVDRFGGEVERSYEAVLLRAVRS